MSTAVCGAAHDVRLSWGAWVTRDNDPGYSSNECGSDPMVLVSLNVPDGEFLQCAAETSIAVESGVTIQSGGRLELILPLVRLESDLAIPSGGELTIDAADPTPP